MVLVLTTFRCTLRTLVFAGTNLFIHSFTQLSSAHWTVCIRNHVELVNTLLDKIWCCIQVDKTTLLALYLNRGISA